MPTLKLLEYPHHEVTRFRLPIVEMFIGGAKRYFVIDTGAVETVLSPRLAGHLNAEQRSTKINREVGGIGDSSASGSFAAHVKCTFIGVTIPFVTFVPSIEALNSRWEDMGIRIDGLIGQDVLQQFSTVEFDFRRWIVRFTP